ncbi:negative elongation factor A-like isoform X2 [Montipora capricornis]|uniref:negative elongation factor A-like isoform X2 n=1 Tax=Montipora capricornis TaxID=246305 RepID=UPI0035F1AB4B
MYCYSFFDFHWFKPVKPCLHRKKKILQALDVYKLQSPSKKFEAPESDHAEEAKYKKLENTKPLEPTAPDYSAGLTPVTQPSKMHVEQQRQIMMRERQQKQAAAVALAASSAASTAPSSVDASKTPSAVPTSATPGSSQQQQGNKRQLALTRDQMLAAHEMFKNANRVSRAEKALILGFMAGVREKPYSHQGPIITIKLSENTENVSASDGSQQTQLVEMLFEMNYDTGHWRRLKRTRVVSKQSRSGPLQKA